MNRVEVFKMTEFADDRAHEISFCENVDPFATPNRGLSRNIDISRYKIRTIRKSMGVSAMMPKHMLDGEIERLSMRGFSPYHSDPYMITMMKEKKFVIADEMIDSAFEDVENTNSCVDLRGRAANFLLIEQRRDINKLNYDVRSQEKVIDNYRKEYEKLDKLRTMSWFNRIFRFKKITAKMMG